MRTWRAWRAAGVGLLAIFGCRDAPELFEPVERTPLGPAPYRLTLSADRDRSPEWNGTGDTIYYLRDEAILGPPPARDTIRVTTVAFRIPVVGGTAERALPSFQTPGSPTSLTDLSVSVDGRLAVYVLDPPRGPLCEAAVPFCGSALAPPSRLAGAELRVRAAGSLEPLSADPRIRVEHAGRRFVPGDAPGGLTGVWEVDVYPFQRIFAETGRIPSETSWSPEGERVVFSDGLGLEIWNPSAGGSTRIPGTEDGLNPAWSPTGEWIAFERLERGSMRETECEYRDLGRLVCFERRREYAVPRHRLAIVRPDGGSLRLLPEGTGPAWSYDGRHLYFEADGRIWRVGLDGNDPVPVPGTEGGSDPAASPDGLLLAYTVRDSVTGGADLWIAAAPDAPGSALFAPENE